MLELERLCNIHAPYWPGVVARTSRVRGNGEAVSLPQGLSDTMLDIVGPEPAVGLPLQSVKSKVADWIHKEHNIR